MQMMLLFCPLRASEVQNNGILEMALVMNWAVENKMTVNLLKAVWKSSFTDQMSLIICYHL